MKLLPRKLQIVAQPQKMQRAYGTSVQYVKYQPQENHLRFQRQHNRSTGELERMVMPRTWLQIAGGLAAGVIIAVGLGMIFL